MPTKHDLEIYQGETFKFGLQLTDSSNNNVFATATSAKCQFRGEPHASDVAAEANCAFSANNVTLWVSLTAGQSANLTPQSGKYDVKVVWPDREDFVVYGKYKVIPTVTR
jgi:hypothetical protein